MDWYDEFLTDVGVDPVSTSDFTSTLSNDDIMESIGMAFGDSTPDWIPTSFDGTGGITNTAAYAQRQGVGPQTLADEKKDNDKGGIIGRISGFVEKNKGLSEMLAKGIAGAALGSQNKKAAEATARSRLEEMRLKNQQEMEANARTSASVAGLRTPTAGLMGRQLRRVDGAPVYQNGRIV